MSFQLSPGVQSVEVDLTTAIETVATTTGAIAGFYRWGPVNERILLTNEPQMAQVLQPPNANNAVFYWSTANFLDYGNSLYVVRANSAGLYNATANNAAVFIPNSDAYFHNNNNGNSGTYGPFAARYPGDLGNSLVVSICPSANAFASNLSTSAIYTSAVNVGQTVIPTTSSIAALMVVGDYVQLGQSSVSNGYIQVTSVGTTSFNIASGGVTANGTSFIINRRWAYATKFNGAPGTSAYTTSKSGSNDQLHIIVIDANGAFNQSTSNNYILEVYPYLSKASDAKSGDNAPTYYQQILFNQSKYIYQMDHLTGTTNWGNIAQGTAFNAPNVPSTFTLAAGSDITKPYGYTAFGPTSTTNNDPNDPGLINAYQYFQNGDEVDISLVPTGPSTLNVQQWVIDNIILSRLDCVGFISPRYGDVINQRGSEASNIVNYYIPSLNRQSSYVVGDSGWKYQFDKYNNTYFYVPLNSDIAGLCANTDRIRAPWWSPAGYNRGQIKNVYKLAWNPGNALNTAYRDLLYSNGINPVMSTKGAGTLLYGDKTLQYQPSAFDRINVRRLFIVLEKAIAAAAKFSLFEFNDNFTRAAFINLVEPFLLSVQGQRGITDFRVVCDATNNTPQVIDTNQFVGDIYIKPARSINFIQLNFVAVGTGVNFNEIVGQAF